jgi:c-di-GMP-binding flagellar brake protein YcgR
VVSVTDGFQLGQRRRYSRAPLALPVRLRPLGGGEEWETATRDLSAGGVRVARTGTPGEESDELQVVLEAAGGIRAEGEVVRRTDTDLSLRFTAIAEDAVVLLQQIAVAYYRLLD